MRTLSKQEMDHVAGGIFLCLFPKFLLALKALCQPKPPVCEPAPQPAPCEPQPPVCEPKPRACQPKRC